MRLRWVVGLLQVSFFLSNICAAQSLNTPEAQTEPAPSILFADKEQYFSQGSSSARKRVSPFSVPLNIWHDQKAIWTSPWHVHSGDVFWLLPLAATTGLLIGTDHHVMTLIHSDAANRHQSSLLSNAGLGAFAGATALSYGIGALTHDEHAREAGALSAEALGDSLAVIEAMKFVTNRQSPTTAGGHGFFGQSSPLASSFPSANAALAWSAAAVFAREYPGPLAQWGAYGLASLVSLSATTSERHFPSDVLIGSAAGYLIGRLIYKTRHDDRMSDRTGSTALSAPAKKSIAAPIPAREGQRASEKSGSPYVPLDSWIYPALKRLAALGYVTDQVTDLAPWTRAECLHQTQEAADWAATRELTRAHPAINEEALRLVNALNAELQSDDSVGGSIRIESIYTRETGIAGTPLRDSYHFGQTVSNDYGRPYNTGVSSVAGFSSYATAGPFFTYFRGEYQNAPGGAAEPLGVRQFIAAADENPLQGSSPVAATNRFEPLEMYAGVRLGFENITFGKQSLWWGPGEDSAFSFSSNAEPFYMLRFAQAEPIVLPGILSRLGKIRTELIVGKLSGHHWPARPYVNAQKITLDLTDNLELGFTRSAFFGGVGHPLTLGAVDASLFSITSSGYGTRSDPGDRHSGFDFRYRVPGLRRFLTIYSDSYADDDPSPLDNPKRSAWAPGLYLPRLPGLSKLDFRFETYSTLLYRKDEGGDFIYWNGEYHDAYTNNSNLLGSWVGRDSRAYVASSTYWFSAKSKLQGKYTQIKAGTNFLPGGGTQTDGSVTGQWSVTPEWTVGVSAQYERYYIPILGGPRRDVLGSLQVVFTPRNWIHSF